ncbi:Rne/Rng family ribonuclease [Bacillus alkalisoli]|uniref:Rne/Rng family ribonuclease n=1 Tax=Bacillus alkalisoli TaxID=2011008 RepID=UPI000C24F2C9|nr:Rne/Rng family ribonuclease [Bacillus alkalisoli]
MKELWMNIKGTEKRIVLKEDGKLTELFFSRPTYKQIEGNIYLGRVLNVLPGMQAAFVDIGEGQPGFIHRDHLSSYQASFTPKAEKEKTSISKWVHQGEAIIVQVLKEGDGNKGPKLTGIIEFTSEHVIYQPHGRFKSVSKKMKKEEREKWRELANSWCTKEEGIIIRTNAEGKAVSLIEKELTDLQQQYIDLQKKSQNRKAPSLLFEDNDFIGKTIKDIGIEEIHKIYIDDSTTFQFLKNHNAPVHFYNGKENIFSHYGIEQEIEKVRKKIVWLPSGGYIIIEHTEAMTVIDVNSGKYTGKTNFQETATLINKEAATEIARQLRVRDIGGIIIIDFIEMKSDKDRNVVLSTFKEETKKDKAIVVPVGFTELDLLQITRKKRREPLTNLLKQSCEACHGAGRVLSAETVAYQLERELSSVSTDIEAVIVETTSNVKRYLQTLSNVQVEVFYIVKEGAPFFELRFLGSVLDAKERLKTLKVY